MGGMCRTFEGEEYRAFWWGTLRDRDHLGDPGVGRMIIIKWVFRKREESMERIDVAQTRDRWWAPVKAVAENRLASPEDFVLWTK